jgi:GNAT superfamily N-acetyltransferase
MYNKDFQHHKMSCVFSSDGELTAVGYLRHGIGDDHDILELIIEVGEKATVPVSEIRKALFPALLNMAQELRDPFKPTKLAAWDIFDGDREFYKEHGFGPYQSYYVAQRSLEDPIPQVEPPIGIEVRHWPMETKEERMQYTQVEKQFYQGVMYRSIHMLEWMMGGPELYTIAAFKGEKLVGSVMTWQTGAVDRLFVVPDIRNKGLGKYLATKAFEYHLAKGRTRVETFVEENNAESIGFLKDLGYDCSIKIDLLTLSI